MRSLIVATLLAFACQLGQAPSEAHAEEQSVSTSAIVDINRADAAALTQLPGIGPSLAERIVAYRAKRPFRNKRELRRVKGIGFRKFTKIEPFVTVVGAKSHGGTALKNRRRVNRRKGRAKR